MFLCVLILELLGVVRGSFTESSLYAINPIL